MITESAAAKSAAAIGAPSVCGALGNYDRSRVLRMAQAFKGEPLAVHEDQRSILMLDREPLAWSGSRQRGLGWIEGDLWRPGPGASGWQEVARRGACGLVVDGRRRFVHSAVNGLAPIYWTESHGVTYFASRIDPLIKSSPDRLSIDWDAWASIITLRYPLGERTPFAEIHRLGPSSTLRRQMGRGRTRAHRWPWAEVDPQLRVDEGAEATAEALRETLSPLDGEVLCPLSGGLDSRLLLSALAGLGWASPIAVTVSDDEGDSFEEDLAAPVARGLSVPHERIGARVDEYPADWEERARRVEHQFVDHAWLMPLAHRIAGAAAPVPDGYAFDVLLQTGVRFHREDVLQAPTPRAGSRALFESLRQYGLAHRALEQRFEAPVVERSRDQFLAAVRPFEGHPSQPVLALYAARTVRGISTYPSGLLGCEAQILTPGVSDRVVTAMLSVSSAEKRKKGMHAAIQAHLAPGLVGLPSTGDTPRSEPHLPRRWRSRPAVEAHRSRLADGPLTPHLSPKLREWLNDPSGEFSPDLRLGMEAVSLLHSWCDRYREHLREVDPADLLA